MAEDVDRMPVATAPSRVGGLSNTQIGDLRSQFLASPHSTDLSQLRPVIARSWQRSLACNVNTGVLNWPEADPRADEQLLLAAEPVLTELEGLCVDIGGAVVLTDADGTLAVYRGDAVQRRNAERLYPTIGAQMREDLIGTNSDGTALEEGAAVQVWGAEHLNEQLSNAYCTSVPIRDPIRRSVRGVVAVMLPEQVAKEIDSRSVLVTVAGAAAEITKRLADRLTAREQALMSEYLREVRKRGADAVVAMDDRTTIVSRSALRMLDQSDFALLAAIARDTEQANSPSLNKLSVSAGDEVMVHARPMDFEAMGMGMGTVMRVHVPNTERKHVAMAARATTRMLESLLGKSWAFRRAADAAETAVRRRMPCYILGEQGTGKLHVARAVAGQLSSEVSVLDFRDGADPGATVAQLDERLAAGAAVVLHHVERAPESFREELADLLAILEQPKLVFTANAVNDDMLPIIVPLRGIEVSVPPLRSRREDIPLLAEHFATEAMGRPTCISAKLRHALVAADWSGNVAQLRELIRSIPSETAGSELNLSDLSVVQLRALSRSRLTRLEEAELQQIRSALVETGGNRAKAASLLGIGRSTLYRKIESYEGRGYDLVLD